MKSFLLFVILGSASIFAKSNVNTLTTKTVDCVTSYGSKKVTPVPRDSTAITTHSHTTILSTVTATTTKTPTTTVTVASTSSVTTNPVILYTTSTTSTVTVAEATCPPDTTPSRKLRRDPGVDALAAKSTFPTLVMCTTWVTLLTQTTSYFTAKATPTVTAGIDATATTTTVMTTIATVASSSTESDVSYTTITSYPAGCTPPASAACTPADTCDGGFDFYDCGAGDGGCICGLDSYGSGTCFQIVNCGGQTCTYDSDCPSGQGCQYDSCCGSPFCVPYDICGAMDGGNVVAAANLLAGGDRTNSGSFDRK